MRSLPVRLPAALCTAGVAAALLSPTAQAAESDFYTYDGSTPLSSLSAGTVLKTRDLPYHIVGVSTPLKAVQILYRSTDAAGKPTANVTTVVRPSNSDGTKAVSYQSAYDSLNPADAPSRAIAGKVSLGGLLANVETVLIAPMLLKGYTVILPDTEGPDANFSAGPEYGYTTLDSLRAVQKVTSTRLNNSTKFALYGYSGGAIGTNWAAQLAPTYAPDVNKKLVGAASGGVLVKPDRNLTYVGGTPIWGGVAGMAIIGIARGFDINFDKYLNDYGKKVLAKMDKASIINVLAQYPGLSWEKIAKPEYKDPRTVPEYVASVNKVNMGLAGSPTIPVFMAQGAGGWTELTPNNQPGIGAGDGVMIAGDVRSLANKYCNESTPAVKYNQYNLLSHFGGLLPWAGTTIGWISDRFAGKKAPSDCGRIAAGNPLTAVTPK
ncbi:lipase family protein [Dermacoccaceae bacterium W4C1]